MGQSGVLKLIHAVFLTGRLCSRRQLNAPGKAPICGVFVLSATRTWDSPRHVSLSGPRPEGGSGGALKVGRILAAPFFPLAWRS